MGNAKNSHGHGILGSLVHVANKFGEATSPKVWGRCSFCGYRFKIAYGLGAVRIKCPHCHRDLITGVLGDSMQRIRGNL